jgi:hypothetical protein
MSAYRPPRREFLRRALAACGAPLLVPGTVSGGSRQVALRSGRGAKAAAQYLGAGSADGARAVGQAYLRHLGVEPTPSSILEVAAGTLTVISRSRSDDDAIAELVKAVRRDFQEDRTVQLDGWLLAITEVELCVLLLLPATG